MVSGPSLSSEKQHRLHKILAEFLAELEAGRVQDRAGLLARYPELAEELNEFFANHDQMARLARPATVVSNSPAGTGASGPKLEAPIPRFGDHEILSEIAHGGMGIVFRAGRSASIARSPSR